MRYNGRKGNGGAVRNHAGPARERTAYVPDVRPFMRQYGYGEGLEEILREISEMPEQNTFYYERGDLWRNR